MLDSVNLLLPRPQEAGTPGGSFALPERPLLSFQGAAARAAGRRLTTELEDLGAPPLIAAGEADADIRLEIDASAVGDGAVGEQEGYVLEVGPRGARVRGASQAGLGYGVATLAQWLRIHLWGQGSGRRVVPALEVVDRPDFAHRGVMLDVSRDKVPTLDTLKQLVDLLASWKINQLQLYMEHTFAYRGHEAVWRGADPLTAYEVRSLEAYCRARHVELVPNQNSFGHFHRWLVHEPYRRLAESPEGIEHPFSFEREPFSLCPTDAGSLELLSVLYDQLLPCFTSGLFNVGLDETFDLGKGRSAAACAERGKGRVYLDFLQQVHGLVRERGKRMQFWGDVILEHPELISELPEDAIALEWGYEADHPFATDARQFAASGLDFYVCPGTGSWNSFAGRTRNTVENLAAAADQGRSHGALGYLITDWGDNGHLQPLPVSYPGLAAGATFAWNAGAAREPHQVPLAQLLDLHAFRDRAGQAGAAVTELGDAYRQTGANSANGSALFFALIFAHKPWTERRCGGLTAAHLKRTLEHVEQAAALIPAARMERPDADLIRRELAWVADTLCVACDLATERLGAGEDQPLSALSGALRADLARRLVDLIESHREIWLGRNRPGGLESSAARLHHVRRQLENT